jgi:radical SAM superfamily enzyme YgiQ (UPF0313 family)
MTQKSMAISAHLTQDPIRVLLVNPPIYDFTAYDFWLRPYGMARIAGMLRANCALAFFDFLISESRDNWGRGRFADRVVTKPETYNGIDRRFRRFGRPRDSFRSYLSRRSFDVVLIQTMMTYWYLGIREVVEDIRELRPDAKIALGGVYATLCPAHASSLGVDLVVEGSKLDPLWHLLGLNPRYAPPYWGETLREVGILKLTEGCPFRCSYCSVPLIYPGFNARPTGETLMELEQLVRLGARHVAFYDDALLHHAEDILMPFLVGVLESRIQVDFHTPNAINARFITSEIAQLMVRAGFRSFFLGFESGSEVWQRMTGGKVYAHEFAKAVESLRDAGADSIIAYIIIGHPDSKDQDVEGTLKLAHDLGTRIMLSEFAPVPGTPDGERSRAWVDMDEPLEHNKTAFTSRLLGSERVTQLKALTQKLNQTL